MLPSIVAAQTVMRKKEEARKKLEEKPKKGLSWGGGNPMAEERRISPAIIIPIGLGLGLVAVLGFVAFAQAAPTTKEYCCPICGGCFDSYDELYAHFTDAHPSEPITIIWE
ncbi:unnamed protein product [marine sediment metagenome]|uniref:C2H2-type domain-containing protein n=1 Tax=marine sediment metagenome TaxID=412755 RepID=X1SPT2_9ZZZZ